MIRRAVLFFLAVCLLTGLVAVPVAPSLVCRMTGQLMTPIEVASDALPAELSCCAVKRTVSAGGKTELALAAPGCCDLSVAPERSDPPPASVPGTAALVLTLAPAPELILPLPAVDLSVTPSVVSDAFPRGPPGRPTSLRAPPFFS